MDGFLSDKDSFLSDKADTAPDSLNTITVFRLFKDKILCPPADRRTAVCGVLKTPEENGRGRIQPGSIPGKYFMAAFRGNTPRKHSGEILQGNIPWKHSMESFHALTVEKWKNGSVTVQKSNFYGSNSGKYYSEPYFLWRDTVKKSKNLFLTVPDSPKVR